MLTTRTRHRFAYADWDCLGVFLSVLAKKHSSRFLPTQLALPASVRRPTLRRRRRVYRVRGRPGEFTPPARVVARTPAESAHFSRVFLFRIASLEEGRTLPTHAHARTQPPGSLCVKLRQPSMLWSNNTLEIRELQCFMIVQSEQSATPLSSHSSKQQQQQQQHQQLQLQQQQLAPTTALLGQKPGER